MNVIVFDTQAYQDHFATCALAEDIIRSVMPTPEVFAGDEQLAFGWSAHAERVADDFPFPHTVVDIAAE
jgi:hypothetical protein